MLYRREQNRREIKENQPQTTSSTAMSGLLSILASNSSDKTSLFSVEEGVDSENADVQMNSSSTLGALHKILFTNKNLSFETTGKSYKDELLESRPPPFEIKSYEPLILLDRSAQSYGFGSSPRFGPMQSSVSGNSIFRTPQSPRARTRFGEMAGGHCSPVRYSRHHMPPSTLGWGESSPRSPTISAPAGFPSAAIPSPHNAGKALRRPPNLLPPRPAPAPACLTPSAAAAFHAAAAAEESAAAAEDATLLASSPAAGAGAGARDFPPVADSSVSDAVAVAPAPPCI